MIYRNGPYGYPSWKQIRVSQNPLSRKQRLHNVFTYVEEPGSKYEIAINGKHFFHKDRYGPIKVFTEPVIAGSHKPLELIGGANFYNPKTSMDDIKDVMIKTSFGNELTFFANDEVNEYYDIAEETDDNYEQLKDLYLNDGLEDDASPIENFNLLTYKQTVWPREKYAYLNKTRSRLYYKCLFWNNDRELRTDTDVENGFAYESELPGGDKILAPSQSIWPLDVDEDWATRDTPTRTFQFFGDKYNYSNKTKCMSWNWKIGASSSQQQASYNTGLVFGNMPVQMAPTSSWELSKSFGGAGILMNSYSQVGRGVEQLTTYGSPLAMYPTTGAQSNAIGRFITYVDGFLQPGPYYARRNTLTYQSSMVSPSGMELKEVERDDRSGPGGVWSDQSGAFQDLFEGVAAWDCGKQAGKTPFYDSYEDFAQNIRLKGKGYSVIPEFRISSHVKSYLSSSIVSPLLSVFELTGAMKDKSNTEAQPDFYKILSTSDFLKHFDLIKKDHQGFTDTSIITMRCKAIKKFLPHDGFYPAQRTAEIAQQFYASYSDHINYLKYNKKDSYPNAPQAFPAAKVNFAFQAINQCLFAPGAMFNTIKAGVACDYPIMEGTNVPKMLVFWDKGVVKEATPSGGELHVPEEVANAYMITGSERFKHNPYDSHFSRRIPFEALVEPENHLANSDIYTMESHPFGLMSETWNGDYHFTGRWTGQGNPEYKKMVNNFLAEVPEFFLKDQNFTTLSSLESSNPQFGNVKSGSFYAMRIKMRRSLNKPNDFLVGWNKENVTPPQDIYPRIGLRETLTMYSRPSAFGPDLWGSGSGLFEAGGAEYLFTGSDSFYGFNFPYTPPYYHGEAWCDVILEATASGKMSVSQILGKVKQFPWYSRCWWPGENQAIRDVAWHPIYENSGAYAGYWNSPWAMMGIYAQPDDTEDRIDIFYPTMSADIWVDGDTSGKLPYSIFPLPHAGVPIQHPRVVNYNAMQINSSVNLFGQGYRRTLDLDTDGQQNRVEVFDKGTVEAKTRWVIQPKFETPILNFNKYTDLDGVGEEGKKVGICTKPQYAAASVPRGMWHQYGDLPSGSEGIYLEIEDLPLSWLKGGLGLTSKTHAVPGHKSQRPENVKSLKTLCGFKTSSKKLGQIASVKQISEAVVAVPFIEKDNTRKFFSIPRKDIDDVISALKREVEPGVFVAGGPPAAGDSVIQMVKKMQRYVFPPPMDFVRYNQIDPFAMYVFEFTHNLTMQDLSDIWQNLPPSIAETFEEAEATISHQLLADELMGGGSVVKNGKLDPNAQGLEIPTNIQWMVFKVKKRAATKYFDKVVAKTGQLSKPPLQLAFERQEDKDKRKDGIDPDITFNWPYDFFSLVELVKLDAEVTFSEFEVDDQGSQVFKTKKRVPRAKVRERKKAARAKFKALGRSGATADKDQTLLDKARSKGQEILGNIKERRKARKEKRGERKEARKEKRGKRKDKRKKKKKGRKDKRKKRR